MRQKRRERGRKRQVFRDIVQTKKQKYGQKNGYRQDKYRGGTSDATTSLSLIVSLLMSFDDFIASKTAIFAVQKKKKTLGLRMDVRTQPLVDTQLTRVRQYVIANLQLEMFYLHDLRHL